jgi:leucine-rich repeat protein SHOC2
MISMRRVCDEVLNWETLVHLCLDDNEISVIDWKMCMDMTQLETLELRRNRIVEIPKQLCVHSSLRKLALSQNRITTLPIALGGMPNLADLQVQGMVLKLPPPSVLHYGTQNVLAYLNSIHQAREDGRCVLNFYDLSEIPQEVLDLVDLTILELDCMKISEIPTAIVGLSNLARLTFNHNLVEHLPVCVSELTNLTELELSNNHVSALSPELFVLTNLAWLNIDHNPIKTPPKEVLDLIMSKFARVEAPMSMSLASLRSRPTTSLASNQLSSAHFASRSIPSRLEQEFRVADL